MIDFLPVMGLFVNFLQEKRSQKDAKDLTFKLWLDQHNHNELVERFAATGCSLDALEAFSKDHAEKLDSITKLLEGMSAQLMANSGAVPAGREQVLSDQAISVLRQLIASKSPGFFTLKTHGFLYLFPDSGGKISHEDHQFIDDDLETLVELGMLRYDGDKNYKITRQAATFIATLSNTSAS